MPDKEGKQRDRHQTGLADLPPEVVLEHLLPVMGDKDIAALSATSKELNVICNTDAFWLERTRTVFSYNPSTLAPAPSTQPIERTSVEEKVAQVSWSKRLYIGLSHPRTFLWGSEGNGRQGLQDARSGRPYAYRRGIRGINRPKEATWQFDLVRSRIQQERNDRQATGGAQGAGWMANFGNSLRRAAGYGGGGDAVDSRGDTGTNTMASSRGGGDGIVELQAGGWSFAARDMQGVIWVWGQMDGSGFNMGGQGWHHPRHTVEEPTPVPLPCRAEAVSVGRNHMLVLDQDNLIWELRSWGRAYHHTAPTLTSPTNPGSTKRPHHIIQVSAGWSHSACLTSSGRVIVWYPFSNAYRDSLTSDTELNGAPGVDENRPFNYRRYTKWGTVGDVVSELPPLPERPEWDRVKYPMVPGLQRTRQDIEREWEEYAHESGWRREKDAEEAEKVVKIASGSDFVIVLKKSGEVWYRHLGDSFDPTEAWQYLPFFSSPKVSHITAGMSTITSYSTSRPSRVNHGRLTPAVVSSGNTEWGNNLHPDPLVELQGKDVIQVALGDYHNLALSARGEVYAWGQGDEGQLGLGQEGVRGPTVNVPKRVSFLLRPTSADGYDEAEDRELRRQVEGRDDEAEGDEGKDEEPFVFAIAAAGWHSGALVLGDHRRAQRIATRASTSTPVLQAAGSEWNGFGHGLQPRMGTGRMIYPEGALQVQPQAPSFTRAPPPVNQPFGAGGPLFRVGLAGALAQHQSSEVPGASASDSHMAGAAGSSRGGGLTGSIRRWVKREAHSGTPSSSASPAAPMTAPSNKSAQGSGGPGGSAGAARDGGDDDQFRPLSGGYAEAAQLRPDNPVNVNGQPTPAFTRGAGQSTYVPEALQGSLNAAVSADTRHDDSPARGNDRSN